MKDETTSGHIKETSPDATDLLIARVKAIPKRKKFRGWFLPGMMLIVFTVEMVILEMAGYFEQSGWAASAALASTLGIGISIWWVQFLRERRMVAALAACKELRVLGCLLANLEFCNRSVRNRVESTILELLPQLKEDDSILLETSDREALNALLYGKSSELAIAAFSGLEQVGDGTALPYLTSMAAGKGIPHALRDRKSEVEARARRTVERIRERIERHNHANVLLRGSQNPSTLPEQLVRPAHSHPLDDGQELLRPVASIHQDSGRDEES